MFLIAVFHMHKLYVIFYCEWNCLSEGNSCRQYKPSEDVLIKVFFNKSMFLRSLLKFSGIFFNKDPRNHLYFYYIMIGTS